MAAWLKFIPSRQEGLGSMCIVWRPLHLRSCCGSGLGGAWWGALVFLGLGVFDCHTHNLVIGSFSIVRWGWVLLVRGLRVPL